MCALEVYVYGMEGKQRTENAVSVPCVFRVLCGSCLCVFLKLFSHQYPFEGKVEVSSTSPNAHSTRCCLTGSQSPWTSHLFFSVGLWFPVLHCVYLNAHDISGGPLFSSIVTLQTCILIFPSLSPSVFLKRRCLF